jgi:hypothetical protein
MSSRPATPPLGTPRGSQLNLAQYAADAKIGKADVEAREGLLNGEAKPPAAGNPSELGWICGMRKGRMDVGSSATPATRPMWLCCGVIRRSRRRARRMNDNCGCALLETFDTDQMTLSTISLPRSCLLRRINHDDGR